MPIFTYTAKNVNGKHLNGKLTADSAQNAVISLKMQGLFPIKIEEQAENEEIRNTGAGFLKGKVSRKHVAIFTRQFAAMLQAGVPLPVILDVMMKQERNLHFKRILESINSDIMKGGTLSGAMAKFSVFPTLLTSMVEVGEVNGRLDASFERVAVSMEKEVKLAAKLKGAMIYPVVLLSVTIIAIVLLTIFVVPVFAKMFEDMGAGLPPLTMLFINLSRFLRNYWYIAGCIILLFIILFKSLFKEPKVKIVLDRMLLKLPIIGYLQNIIFMARFCRTLSSLFEGGVGVVISLETVRNVIGNLYIRSCFDEIIRDVQSGSTISMSVSKFNIFTTLTVSMVRIGEESGRLGEVLAKTAELYEDESEVQLQKATALVEPLVTLIMALGIGFVLLAVIQPMFGMYRLIGK